jgi:hypothetical protein
MNAKKCALLLWQATILMVQVSTVQRMSMYYLILARIAQYNSGYWDGRMGNCGSIPGKGRRFFFPPQCLDQLWGPPILLFNV